MATSACALRGEWQLGPAPPWDLRQLPKLTRSVSIPGFPCKLIFQVGCVGRSSLQEASWGQPPLACGQVSLRDGFKLSLDSVGLSPRFHGQP